jgi:hypothetical protein
MKVERAKLRPESMIKVVELNILRSVKCKLIIYIECS